MMKIHKKNLQQKQMRNVRNFQPDLRFLHQNVEKMSRGMMISQMWMRSMKKRYSTTLTDDTGTPLSHGVFTFDRRQWFELIKWARHSGTLSHDQRIQIVRMGRLIQKNRKLTKKQEDQVNEMIALVEVSGLPADIRTFFLISCLDFYVRTLFLG